MQDIITSEAVPANAPDATPGVIGAQITFYKQPDGMVAIEGCHIGDFDIENRCHSLLDETLKLIAQILMATQPRQVDQTHESTETVQ